MIETVILNYLAEKLDVGIYMETPEKPPKSWIRVQKTSSTKSNHICNSMFAIQSYAGSLYEAALLNESVKEAMRFDNIGALDEITDCRLNSDYEYIDQMNKRYRYQAVFDISHY